MSNIRLFVLVVGCVAGSLQSGFVGYDFDPYSHWTSRHLMQSDQELKMLCNVSSAISGAQVVFNENLLQRLCTDQLDSDNGACKDMPPIWQELQTELPCSVVVSEGLCNDNFVTRANYCAKSCNRCSEQTCTKTLAGCSCSTPWTFRETGASYQGCANPDGDPKGTWCEIDRSTCEREPATKTYDYCSSQCSASSAKHEENAMIINDDEVPFALVPQPPSCSNHKEECAESCGGEHKVNVQYCDIEGEKCECVEEESCEDLEQKCDRKCSQNGEQIVEFSCSADQEQQTICQCGTQFTKLPSPSPASTIRTPSPLSRTLSPIPTPSPARTPASAVTSQEDLFQDTLIVGKCFNYLPPQEATCSERLKWGSCTEWWMEEKYYCAATCGYCGSTGDEHCFDGFKQCASDCGGDMMIQFFACYKNYGGKTDCVCRDTLRDYLPAVSNLNNEPCEDVAPPGGNTCEERVNWGSCSEWWFRQGNYCAKSCGYCRDSNDPSLQQQSSGSNQGVSDTSILTSTSPDSAFLDPAGITAARSVKYDSIDESAVFQSLGMIPIFTDFSFYDNSSSKDTVPFPQLALFDNLLEESKGLLAEDFLQAHNSVRSEYCVDDLTWSKTLASESEAWASKCVMEVDTSTPHGQNLFMDGTRQGTSASTAVQNWILDTQDYNFERPVVGMKFATLTQVLWKGTTQVGCAAAQCPRGQMVVCRYDPTGNVPGSTAENVIHPSVCT
eukprot:TRINITY_DN7719_c0_g1_i2.p1 TRINITY_DN7719_c0_g1~~TRINITY_DN7719_c0_g1_i2.p1  ORF type:complete len:727 (+),score=88.51 TRINITY_DN7719_c0_g1_i2:344-2524(+)